MSLPLRWALLTLPALGGQRLRPHAASQPRPMHALLAPAKFQGEGSVAKRPSDAGPSAPRVNGTSRLPSYVHLYTRV